MHYFYESSQDQNHDDTYHTPRSLSAKYTRQETVRTVTLIRKSRRPNSL